MELDDLKTAWIAMDRRLEEQRSLQRKIHIEYRLDRLGHGLRPLLWGQWIQMPSGIGAMLWGISFWTSHAGNPIALTCGLIMQAFGMLMVAFSARLLALAQGIDYASPVLEIQRRLTAMRIWRVKVEARVFAVLGSFIWIPAMLMLIQRELDRNGFENSDLMLPFIPRLLVGGAASLLLVILAY